MATLTVTIDTSKVSKTLTNFPVRLELSASNFDFSEAGSAGGGIFFSLDQEGTRLLPFARVFHSEADQKAVYYIKLPKLWHKGSQSFYLHYSDISTDYEQRVDAWDLGYISVVPLQEPTAKCVILEEGPTQDQKDIDDTISPTLELDPAVDCTGLTANNHQFIAALKCSRPETLREECFCYIGSNGDTAADTLSNPISLSALGMERFYKNFSLALTVADGSIDVAAIDIVRIEGELDTPYKLGLMAFRSPRLVFTSGDYNWYPDFTRYLNSFMSTAEHEPGDGRGGHGRLFFDDASVDSQFDGIIDVGDRNFTLEMWVTRSSGKKLGTIIEVDDSSVACDTSGNVRMRWNSDIIDKTLSAAIGTEQSHIAIVRDGSLRRMSLVVNGVRTDFSTATDGVDQTLNEAIKFFTTHDSDVEFVIDEVRLSNVARSDAWLLTEYHNGLGQVASID